METQPIKTPSSKMLLPVSSSAARVLIAALMLCIGSAAFGYYNNDRWTVVSTPPFVVGPVGTAVDLTWGIADDGTNVPNVLPGVDRSSNLIARLDSWFGDGGEPLLENRPWFPYIESSFERWDELSGLSFAYEPNDDGAQLNTSSGNQGIRGDVRLAGARYDGNSGVLAYNIAPDDGDVFLDTDDTIYYGNPANNAFNLRHTLMHELGHALGLGHITSQNSAQLMEPFSQTSFDGPQIDDIRGVQFLYGDALEKNGGNNTQADATPLGTILGGETSSVGADGASGSTVLLSDTDFVSINNSSDTDYFSFSLTGPSIVDVTLTPVGPTYRQRPENTNQLEVVNSSAVGDLALQLLAAGGATLGSSDAAGVGSAESLTQIELPAGDYAVRVSGTTAETQLYQLDVAAVAAPLVGDFNGDGVVDPTDYSVFQDTFSSQLDLRADANGNGIVDAPDYIAWRAAYADAITGSAIPEPITCAMAALACAVIALSPRAGAPISRGSR